MLGDPHAIETRPHQLASVPGDDKEVGYESKAVASPDGHDAPGRSRCLAIRKVAARLDAHPWLIWKKLSTRIDNHPLHGFWQVHDQGCIRRR